MNHYHQAVLELICHDLLYYFFGQLAITDAQYDEL